MSTEAGIEITLGQPFTSGSSGRDGVDSAGTAGGDDDALVADGDGVRADLDPLATALREQGATAPDEAAGVPTVFANAREIADADRVEDLLDLGVERGRFADTGEGGYYLLDG